jgi:amino acid permease
LYRILTAIPIRKIVALIMIIIIMILITCGISNVQVATYAAHAKEGSLKKDSN